MPGDAAATAREIAAHEPLWRLGLALNLLYLPAAMTVVVLLYELFKPEQATLARLALAFAVANVTIEAVSLLLLYVPLGMAEEGGTLALLGEEQRHALAYPSVRLHAAGFAISLLFFACSCMLIGVLILRSWLLPHAIGAMMVVAGACYLVNSLVYVAAPALSDVLVPWILLPCFLGELLLASWLAVKGVSVAAPEARRPLGRAPSSS